MFLSVVFVVCFVLLFFSVLQALGDCLGLSLPVAAAANEQFKRARGDHGNEDFCAVYQASKK